MSRAVDDEIDPDQSFDVPTIRELIRKALDGGKSVRDLAEDSGYRVKFQTFQDLSNHAPKQFPKDPKTITGMALALKVSETSIVLAYAKSLGITVATGSNLSMRLPADVDKLSPDMQDAIVSVARAALERAPEKPVGSRNLPGDSETSKGRRAIR
jgi:hypothetical protein